MLSISFRNRYEKKNGKLLVSFDYQNVNSPFSQNRTSLRKRVIVWAGSICANTHGIVWRKTSKVWWKGKPRGTLYAVVISLTADDPLGATLRCRSAVFQSDLLAVCSRKFSGNSIQICSESFQVSFVFWQVSCMAKITRLLLRRKKVIIIVLYWLFINRLREVSDRLHEITSSTHM